MQVLIFKTFVFIDMNKIRKKSKNDRNNKIRKKSKNDRNNKNKKIELKYQGHSIPLLVIKK